MITILSSSEFYSADNNGWIYIANASDGNYYVRSVLGKWAVVDAPVDLDTLNTDFTTFLGKGSPATLESVAADNIGNTKDAIA